MAHTLAPSPRPLSFCPGLLILSLEYPWGPPSGRQGQPEAGGTRLSLGAPGLPLLCPGDAVLCSLPFPSPGRVPASDIGTWVLTPVLGSSGGKSSSQPLWGDPQSSLGPDEHLACLPPCLGSWAVLSPSCHLPQRDPVLPACWAAGARQEQQRPRFLAGAHLLEASWPPPCPVLPRQTFDGCPSQAPAGTQVVNGAAGALISMQDSCHG